ncbi:S8 family serine peptidase, partial [Streptomyces sp. NPDC007070]|uniref:S8 family serine peptidase n=1 Tax=Streptomyces sp. NPDC007070 TaxID=3154312 RepID=UPI0033FC2CE6
MTAAPTSTGPSSTGPSSIGPTGRGPTSSGATGHGPAEPAPTSTAPSSPAPTRTASAEASARRPAVRRTAALGVLLVASLALVPAGAAYADGIRAKQWALDALHTQQLWRTTQGKGVTVAVLDTGVEADHPDLDGNVLPAKDLIGFGARPGDRDWARHGTAMAGIIAG